MSAYYNEFDPEKAEWIRELMKAGVVADGEVDERSITDVRPGELAGFTQCHFFAGIAVWSFALRLAGWSDDEPVWTGSCPCPSFSAAGKGAGFDDPRHLWPDWARLVRESKPPVIFGEQADKAIGYGWLDLVQTDLEAADYAFGKAVLGAASIGAPHIRQRAYFVAHALRAGTGRNAGNGASAEIESDSTRLTNGVNGGDGTFSCRTTGDMANATEQRWNRRGAGEARPNLASAKRGGSKYQLERLCAVGELGDAEHARHRGSETSSPEPSGNGSQGRLSDGTSLACILGDAKGSDGKISVRRRRQEQDSIESRGTSPLSGFWRDAEWVWCRDERYRPVEPGSFPLAHGAAARVLRLRGYGDAINAEVAKAFIESYREVRGEMR